jgi:DNA-directed RNA polymerase II subunit RPB1
MKLARPVFHVNLISKVIKVLQCVCWNCGKLRKPAKSKDMMVLQESYGDRASVLLAAVAKACNSVKTCQRFQKGEGANADVEGAEYGCGEAHILGRRSQEAV